MALSKSRNLSIVEDCAHALGSKFGKFMCGTIGNIGCFSFYPTKIITTGEGGMVITNDEETADKCRILRDHGAVESDLVRHRSKTGFLLAAFEQLGFNYRMTDLQAAIGVCQMDKLNDIQESRRWLAARYDEALASISWLNTPAVPEGSVHSYQAYVCRIAGLECDHQNLEQLHQKRNRVMHTLQADGINTRQGTHAVHDLELYRRKYDLESNTFPQSHAADRLTIALPLYQGLTEHDQDRVIAALTQVELA